MTDKAYLELSNKIFNIVNNEVTNVLMELDNVEVWLQSNKDNKIYTEVTDKLMWFTKKTLEDCGCLDNLENINGVRLGAFLGKKISLEHDDMIGLGFKYLHESKMHGAIASFNKACLMVGLLTNIQALTGTLDTIKYDERIKELENGK